jgi:predicted protein tyrosine phosphatase
MVRALFICSQNKLRSPTAEDVFAAWENVETSSAGTDEQANSPVEASDIEWAEVIFLMERSHKQRITNRFGEQLRSKRVVVLDIPDNYTLMEPALIRTLERKVGPYLVRMGATPPPVA